MVSGDGKCSSVEGSLGLDGKSDQLPSSQGKGDEVDRTGLAVTDSDGSQVSCNMHWDC